MPPTDRHQASALLQDGAATTYRRSLTGGARPCPSCSRLEDEMPRPAPACDASIPRRETTLGLRTLVRLMRGAAVLTVVAHRGVRRLVGGRVRRSPCDMPVSAARSASRVTGSGRHRNVWLFVRAGGVSGDPGDGEYVELTRLGTSAVAGRPGRRDGLGALAERVFASVGSTILGSKKALISDGSRPAGLQRPRMRLHVRSKARVLGRRLLPTVVAEEGPLGPSHRPSTPGSQVDSARCAGSAWPGSA
jgi:hypothetical protein